MARGISSPQPHGAIRYGGRTHHRSFVGTHEAIVRYLVHPKESGRVQTELTRKLLEALNAQPEKALFPKSNAR